MLDFLLSLTILESKETKEFTKMRSTWKDHGRWPQIVEGQPKTLTTFPAFLVGVAKNGFQPPVPTHTWGLVLTFSILFHPCLLRVMEDPEVGY